MELFMAINNSIDGEKYIYRWPSIGLAMAINN